MAASELFYRGGIGAEFAAAVQAQGGLVRTQASIEEAKATLSRKVPPAA